MTPSTVTTQYPARLARRRRALVAGRRLVAKGHLTERSLDAVSSAASALREGAMSAPAFALRGGGAANPFLGSAETAAGPRGDAPSPSCGGPPAPCPAAIPPE